MQSLLHLVSDLISQEGGIEHGKPVVRGLAEFSAVWTDMHTVTMGVCRRGSGGPET